MLLRFGKRTHFFDQLSFPQKHGRGGIENNTINVLRSLNYYLSHTIDYVNRVASLFIQA